MRNPEQMSGYTGGLLESEVFGDVDLAKINSVITELKLSPKDIECYTKDEYLPYDKSVELVKKIQTKDLKDLESGPSNPKNKFANDLHATLADKLELEDLDDLRFYSAVGTPLDYKHGVDSFFEIDIEKETGKITVLVTIDATMRTGDTTKTQKANVLLRMPEGAPDPDDKDYEDKLQKIADAIGEVIKSGDKYKKVEVTV